MTGTRPVSTGEYWNDPSTISAFSALPAPAYLTDLLAAPIADDALAVDAGCGTGRNLPSLVSAGYRVLAVDLHAGMLNQARARHASPRTTFVNATITSIPAGDQQASLVVCHGVLHNLHHREDLGAGLRELHRVLAIGGTLSLNTFTAEFVDPCLAALGDDVYALPNGQFMTLLTPDELVYLVHQAGLSLRGNATQYISPGDPGQRSVWRATLTRV